jgi:hypothetical protein
LVNQAISKKSTSRAMDFGHVISPF